MAEEGNSYDFLGFVALSTSVHADAVQCEVDDLRKVLHQMHSEEALLKAYEAKVSSLSEESQKLHVMDRLVSLSREERRKAKPLRAEGLEPPYGGPAPKQIQSTKHPQPTHFSASPGGQPPRRPYRTGKATPGKAEGEVLSTSAIPAASGGRPEVELASIANTTLSLDTQLAQLQGRMEELDSMSIRTKLTTLESLKRQAKEVEVGDILHRQVASFRFPSEVSSLWKGGGAARKLPRQPASLANPNEPRDGPHGPVINQGNIETFLERAACRLKERYQHLLHVLTECEETTEDDVSQLLEYFLYAQKLESADNYDITAAQVLEGLQNHTLEAHYAQTRSHFTADANLSKRCLAKPHTVLSYSSYCALPMVWEIMQELNSVPLESLLPPARHILTPRFSFTNLSELNKLDRLRVQIQRLLLAGLLSNRQLVDDMLRLEGDSQSIDLKEETILKVRATIADVLASCEKSPAWITTVSIENEPHE
ncbi:unnamed protein product [Phytomonas sp. Hart1]|nr:unnamed protein product [Phytomonas sp. Hart1]|eukprot:CCW66568.1 unnamed protein product [Phytomonas sp. isolate Hart1]